MPSHKIRADYVAVWRLCGRFRKIGHGPQWWADLGWRRLAHDARCHRHDGCEITEVTRDDERGAFLRELAELADVLLADPKLHRLDAAALAECSPYFAQAFRGGGCNRENSGGLPFCLIDLLLFSGLGRLDHALLVAFSLIDLRVAFTLGRQNDRTLLPLGPHLLFHRRQHIFRWCNVLDLIPHYLHAPRPRCLVQLRDDIRVDDASGLERPIELDLADFAAQGGLGKLGDRKAVVSDAV